MSLFGPRQLAIGFAARPIDGLRLSFDFTWYDGNQFPGETVIAAVGAKENVPRSGSVVIGETGALVIPHGGGGAKIYRDGKLSDEEIETLPSEDHHRNWVDAIRGESSEKPRANFSYAGPMTEAVLLGTVAMRLPGQELKWDKKSLTFTNSQEATDTVVRRTYRDGFAPPSLKA